MGKAYFKITHALLAEFLHLPKGTKVIGVEQSTEECLDGRLRVYIKAPDLPKQEQGSQMRCVDPLE